MSKKLSLNQVIENLVNSASDEGCSDGLTVVDGKWVELLQKHLDEVAIEEVKREKASELDRQRTVTAQELFESAKLSVACEQSQGGWDTDSDDTYLKRFWYDDERDMTSSKMGSYIVRFKNNSAKVLDHYESL